MAIPSGKSVGEPTPKGSGKSKPTSAKMDVGGGSKKAEGKSEVTVKVPNYDSVREDGGPLL